MIVDEYDPGFMGDVVTNELTGQPNERVCVLYQHPSKPNVPDWVWNMRRRNIPNWSRSLAKQGFRLVGIVREKRNG